MNTIETIEVWKKKLLQNFTFPYTIQWMKSFYSWTNTFDNEHIKYLQPLILSVKPYTLDTSIYFFLMKHFICNKFLFSGECSSVVIFLYATKYYLLCFFTIIWETAIWLMDFISFDVVHKSKLFLNLLHHLLSLHITYLYLLLECTECVLFYYIRRVWWFLIEI